MTEMTNAIMDWCAGYESGVCTTPGGSRIKIIRGIAEFALERVAKSTVPSTVPRHLLSRRAVKIKGQGARWLGNCRRSQSQGMDAGEVSHRVRMDELRPVVPGPSCS